jgi:hypothetical protein
MYKHSTLDAHHHCHQPPPPTTTIMSNASNANVNVSRSNLFDVGRDGMYITVFAAIFLPF